MKKSLIVLGLAASLFMGAYSSVSADCKTGNSSTTVAKPAAEKDKLVKDSQEVTDNTYFVNAKWVKDQIKNNPKTVVLSVAYGKVPGFSKGHVPTAMQFSTNNIESEKNHWNILSPEACRKAFTKYGVTKDTNLIVYSPDVMAASRVAFVAYWLGVKDVKIMDGGLQAWKNAGYSLEKKSTEPKKVDSFGTDKVAHPEVLISTPNDLLKDEKANKDMVLVSTRSKKEYMGNISGYNYIKNTGEVKGAVYGKISKTSGDVAYLTNDDKTMKNPAEELKYWKDHGITPDKEVVFYCGTGWRATAAFFLAKEEGYDNVKIYDGGWYDWDKSHQKDPKKYPVQKGTPGTSSYKVYAGNEASR